MSRAELIYPLRKNMERELGKIKKDPCNKQILTRYYKVRSSEVSLATLLADFIRLNAMSKILGKKFERVTVKDIENLIFKIDAKTKADSTKNKFRQSLKQFFRWMKGCSPGENPPEVKWIRRKKVPLVTVTPDDLIPFDECIGIGEMATNLRDKAFVQCHLDAGGRIGEILTPKICEVEFNDNGAVIYAEGKTGSQPLILTWSAKILGIWLNNHPFRNNKDAPLWPVLGASEPRQLSYAAARKFFAGCVKRAGYTRRIWPHLFKHVSSSHDSEIGMPDSYRRYKHHWTPNSRMPQVYEHLSKSVIHKIQSDTWNRMGVSKNEKVSKPVEVLKSCRRCAFENPRDSLYCNRCGFSLEEKKATELVILKTKTVELLNKLQESPEKLEAVLEVLNKDS